MADDQTHDVLVDFDPLRITLPGAGPFVGRVRISLPEHHVKLLDLSMGIDLLAGAHVGGDGRVYGFEFTVPEPGITAGQLTEFIAVSQEQLKLLHRVIQEELDKRFLLGGKR